MSTLTYRPDIDGLRALAVISVLIFHLEPSYLPGGFLGVDIFFVISGYLITSIILKDMDAKSFSFVNFYVKRVKRILPPLFFILLLICIASYFILMPYDFYKAGISLVSVLLFASNVQYSLRTNDYFSGDSSEWPMLHTWSLAVEEQYYFIFPIIALLIFRFHKNKKLLIFVVICIASFALAEYMSRQKSLNSMSYYLIVTRMGELMIGSLLALGQRTFHLKRFTSELVALASLVIIIFLLVFIDKTSVFPGFIALILCIPVALIINSENTIVNRLFGTSAFVYIGTLSYSIYLVHWPVLAFFRYVFNIEVQSHSLSLQHQALALIIIATVSIVSFYCIESPLRRLQLSSKKTFVAYLILPSALFLIFGAMVIQTKGLPERIQSPQNTGVLEYSHIDKSKCPEIVNLGCIGGNPSSKKEIILFGNSHAEHYFEFFNEMAKDRDAKLSLFASGGCSLISTSTKCRKVIESFNISIDNSQTIFVAYRWDTRINSTKYIDSMNSFLQGLVENGHEVIVLAQPPMLDFHPTKVFNCERLGFTCNENGSFSDKYPSYNKRLQTLLTVEGLRFFDPFEYLNSPIIYRSNGKLLYSDADHLSVVGSKWLYAQVVQNEDFKNFKY